MARRRQLVEMRVAESHRLEQARGRAVRSIQLVMKTLDKPLEVIDTGIDSHLDQLFESQRNWLDSVKGVGSATILTLTAALPELGQLVLTILNAMLEGQVPWSALKHEISVQST